MNKRLKASSIQEYASSVLKISKKLNSQEKKEFSDALSVVAIDLDFALSITYFHAPSRTVKLVTKVVKRVDGKTPHEVILEADRIIQRLKKELVNRGRKVDGKSVKEILHMANDEKISYWVWGG